MEEYWQWSVRSIWKFHLDNRRLKSGLKFDNISKTGRDKMKEQMNINHSPFVALLNQEVGDSNWSTAFHTVDNDIVLLR